MFVRLFVCLFVCFLLLCVLACMLACLFACMLVCFFVVVFLCSFSVNCTREHDTALEISYLSTSRTTSSAAPNVSPGKERVVYCGGRETSICASEETERKIVADDSPYSKVTNIQQANTVKEDADRKKTRNFKA